MKYDLRLKGFVGSWDFDPDYVQYILDKFPDRQVDVIIDSTGGSLFTALSISAAFRLHGNVHVHFVGANASAATVASLGAKSVSMDEQAVYLVHRCSAFICEFDNMNAEQIDEKCRELQKVKENLQTLDITVAAAYAKRCKKTPEELHALMEKDTWLSAKEAKEWGFVDEVTDLDEDPAPVIDVVTACAFEKSGIPIPRINNVDNHDKSFFARLAGKIADNIKPFFKNSIGMDNLKSQQSQQQEGAGIENGNENNPAVSASRNSGHEQNVADNNANDFEAYKAEKEKEIDNLKKQISDLAKQPADSHKSVVAQQTAEANDGGFYATARSARELYNSLP